MSNIDNINIVWLKRDLRLTDHLPLYYATQKKEQFLILYIYEPSLMKDVHYDERHWRFIEQSLMAIQEELDVHDKKLTVTYGEAVNVFKFLLGKYCIKHIFSHEETGLNITFTRDHQLKLLFAEYSISWIEPPSNAVIRGLLSRQNWEKHWSNVMREPIQPINFLKAKIISHDFCSKRLPTYCANELFQKGGFKNAHYELKSFF